MPETSEDGTQALLGRQRIRSFAAGLLLRGVLPLAFLLLPGSAGRASAQDALPPDTFEDEATRELVTRAIAARDLAAEGIQSYEATLRERMYVGVTALGFRRERSLFEHQRIARVRWSETGDRAIQWIGARTAVPIVGLDNGEPDAAAGRARFENGDVNVRVGGRNREPEDPQDLATDYLDETDFPGFDFDPGGNRLRFGDDWAYHPLSDSSLVHYRYSLGDTLRVVLPANERSVVLFELKVEPRRADFELVAGSLWLDSETAALVRATYRPARPWSLRVDEPEDAAEVPGFIGAIEAEIRYITVESSLQELRYWLPRRFAFQGEGRAGGLLRVPVTLEWTVGGYVVNEPPFDVLVDGDLPEGWQRDVTVETDDDGNETRYTVIVPTSEELREPLADSPDFQRQTPVSFTDAEIEDLASRLEGLLPTYERFRPHLAWGLEQGQVRFNRVEGLSVGTSAAFPLAPELSLDLSARIGTGDREPNVAGGLRWGPERSQFTIEGYHRLASMSDADDPFDLPSSAMNLVFGTDRGQYYRATGATATHSTRGPSVTSRASFFWERERAVERTTDFFVADLFGDDTVDVVLPADDIDVAGGRLTLGWFSGTDPRGLIVTGAATAESGFGDAVYQRLTGRASATHPLFFGLAGAAEVAAGTTWGDVPLQRVFFLGSAGTLRGFNLNEHWGPSFWRARGEVATAFAGARIGLFSDVGWVGEPSAFGFDDPLVSVGVGASLLDGIVRIDLAKAVRGSDRWKAYLYLDGLF